MQVEPGRVPQLQAETGRWSAFVAPDLAAVFGDEPVLDIPPGDEAQAELLASGLLGMAQIAARRWLREEPRMAREAAVDLIAGLGWRGIGGFPLSHPPTA